MGQASPQPMVMTTSAALTNSSLSGLGNSLDRSMPHSSMAAATAGSIRSAGSLPAERTWTLPLAWWSRRAAAIWLRPALWTQTNRTSGTSFTMAPSGLTWSWFQPARTLAPVQPVGVCHGQAGDGRAEGYGGHDRLGVPGSPAQGGGGHRG